MQNRPKVQFMVWDSETPETLKTPTLRDSIWIYKYIWRPFLFSYNIKISTSYKFQWNKKKRGEVKRRITVQFMLAPTSVEEGPKQLLFSGHSFRYFFCYGKKWPHTNLCFCDFIFQINWETMYANYVWIIGHEGEGAVQQEDAVPMPATALVIIMIISNHRIILNHYWVLMQVSTDLLDDTVLISNLHPPRGGTPKLCFADTMILLNVMEATEGVLHRYPSFL